MTVKQDIHDWIQNFLGKRNPNLNNWAPCPYARQALREKRVDIRIGTIPERDAKSLASADFTDFDVVLFVYNPTMFDADDFSARIQLLNRQLSAQDMLALDDHPDNKETVNDVTFNNGQYALMFTQSLSKLNSAAQILAAKGYYDTWPEEYLTDLFAGRVDPRSSEN